MYFGTHLFIRFQFCYFRTVKCHLLPCLLQSHLCWLLYSLHWSVRRVSLLLFSVFIFVLGIYSFQTEEKIVPSIHKIKPHVRRQNSKRVTEACTLEAYLKVLNVFLPAVVILWWVQINVTYFILHNTNFPVVYFYLTKQSLFISVGSSEMML